MQSNQKYDFDRDYLIKARSAGQQCEETPVFPVAGCYLLRWQWVNRSAIKLWLSDVKSLQLASRCSRARAQHSPYRDWAARVRTRRSSTLPRSESGAEEEEECPGPAESPSRTEPLSSSSTTMSARAAILTCLQVNRQPIRERGFYPHGG